MEKQPLTRQVIGELKSKARELIEQKGMPQKEAAREIGISEKTMTKWVIVGKWQKNNEIIRKQKRAKQLILVQGWNQKETAKMVGVSEKSISQWCKKFKWKQKNKFEVPNIEQIKFAINNFLLYIDCTTPAISKQVSQLSIDFFKEEPELLTIMIARQKSI